MKHRNKYGRYARSTFRVRLLIAIILIAWAFVSFGWIGLSKTHTLIIRRSILSEKAQASNYDPCGLDVVVCLSQWDMQVPARCQTTAEQIERILQESYPHLLEKKEFFLKQVIAESGCDAKAVGDGGKSIGIAQINENTVKSAGITKEDRWNAEKSISAMIGLMDKYHTRFGSWKKALVAYNCGANCVTVPNSTKAYISKVLE